MATPADILTAIGGVALLLLALTIAIFWVQLLIHWRAFLKPHLLEAWEKVKKIFDILPGNEPVARRERIAKLVSEKRLNRCRAVLPFIALVFWPYGVFMYVSFGLQVLEVRSPSTYHRKEDVIAQVLHTVFMIYMVSKPNRVNRGILRLAYWYWMLRYTLMALLLESDPVTGSREIFRLLQHIFARAFAGIVLGDARLVISTNVLCFAALAVGVFVFDAYDPISFALNALSGLLTAIAVVILEVTEWNAMRERVEASTLRHFEGAAESLLLGMCDAVVHLSSSLEIINPSPKLSGLLLHAFPLEGVNFVELVEDRDRPAFLEFVNRAPDAIAGTKYTALKDSNQMRVPVQIFHTVCLDGQHSGGHIHLLGIRDIGEEERLLQEQQLGGQSAASPARNGISHQHSEDSVSELGSVQSFEVSKTGSDPEVSVWISLETMKFEMVACTPAFVSIVGPSRAQRGKSLIDNIVARSDQSFVEKELQKYTSRYWNGEEEDQEIRFVLAARGTHRQAVAVVSLDFDKDESGDIAVIHFVRLKRPKKNSAARSQRWEPRASLIGADILLHL